jgi:hypothetical protein
MERAMSSPDDVDRVLAVVSDLKQTASSDLSTPVPNYLKQSQFAMGGLVGYDFGPVILQGYVTSDVYQKNYGGTDVRGWLPAEF